MRGWIEGAEVGQPQSFYADPICGEDFCERCGECLNCMGWQECLADDEGHTWVIDAERAKELTDGR